MIFDELRDGLIDLSFVEFVVVVKGKWVKLMGVGFLLLLGICENEIGEEEVIEFFLLFGNGGVVWCCGFILIFYVEFSVVVECYDLLFFVLKLDL